MAGKKRILIFCDFYLPSLGGGGGMRYVANIVERFHDRFDFFIVARNHNSRIDREPLPDIVPDRWNRSGKAAVYYFSRGALSQAKVAEIVEETKPDLVFLNSLFSRPSIRFFVERLRRGWKEIPVAVSLCGELLEVAIAHNPIKKRGFLAVTELLRLHRNVLWRASTEREKAEAENVLGRKLLCHISPDTTPPAILPEFSASMKPAKIPGKMRLVFLSRVVPSKNLDFALRALAGVTSGEIELEIIGAEEDAAYWSECKRLIEKLPGNVKVHVAGALQNEEALQRLCDSHFFILPTKWENFGYVMIEALAAGCPLIVSDRTDWNDVGNNGGGWFLPLEDEAAWLKVVQKCLDMNNDEFQSMSAAARAYAVDWLAQPDREKSTLELFDLAFETTRLKK